MSEAKNNTVAKISAIAVLIGAIATLLGTKPHLLEVFFSKEEKTGLIDKDKPNEEVASLSETNPKENPPKENLLGENTVKKPVTTSTIENNEGDSTPNSSNSSSKPSTQLIWSNTTGFACSGVIKGSNKLTKSHASSKWDSGCISQNYIPANGSGKVVFTIKEIKGSVLFGLTNKNETSNFEDINFAVGLNYIKKDIDTEINIYKSGAYQGKKGTGYLNHQLAIDKNTDGWVTIMHLTAGGSTELASFQADGKLYLDTSIRTNGAQIGPFELFGDWRVDE